jgi:signal transduction histidine kinase
VPEWHNRKVIGVDAEWIKSPMARRVLLHWSDPRPAWLWSADGQTLLWRNRSARLFGGKIKKHGMKLVRDAVPIKGQVSRLIRLGSVGRSSLSRLQFLVGEHPASTTCTATPLLLAEKEKALLIVAVDPIDEALRGATAGLERDPLTESLFPPGSSYLLVEDGQASEGSAEAVEQLAPIIESNGVPDDGTILEIGDRSMLVSRFQAAPQDAVLLLFEPQAEPTGGAIDVVRAEEGLTVLDPQPIERRGSGGEPLLPLDLPPAPPQDEPVATGIASDETWVEPMPLPHGGQTLSSLFDRLADRDALYEELPPVEETQAADVPEAPEEPRPEAAASEEAAGQDDSERDAGEPDEAASHLADNASEEAEPPPSVAYRVIGRGFTSLAADEAEPSPTDRTAPDDASATEEEDAGAAAISAADVEVVERVSRYNFDELSRILSDRVGNDTGTKPPEAVAATAEQRAEAAPAGALINLSAETFILNRVPLGILVFRDQQVLFANRALNDLTGHDSADGLRSAGLAEIFPADPQEAGPVTHLVRRDGTLLPVMARLQSVIWHGRPALMLSASPVESRTGHEGAVRTFAELMAEVRGEGFVTTDRAGIVTLVSLPGRLLLQSTAEDPVGQPLSSLIHPDDGRALQTFLERPARFAETTRPSLVVRGSEPETEILLFAEGQAGIVIGYFGFVRRTAPAAQPAADGEEMEPSMMSRVSRGVRRPLNTIIGFADMIRSAAFGVIENQRYLEYALDIKTAGQEIAVLVDELDDYARLKEGRYAARPADLDLVALLESCIVRVRRQASDARVLVRSAISERLPGIRADRASLGQAILNLLASAIDQTPAGGSVILSAQVEDDGSVVVNVRDSGDNRSDLAERFVVFRDGVGREGEPLAPVRSSVGLALTRSLLAVNSCSLSVDPSSGVGTLFSVLIPAELVAGMVTTA